MKLVGIGTVKNEADIIESFVRHNLGRLDALVLIDDGSVDGTREILLSLEAEGLNLVTLEWDGSSGQEQSMKLSELLLVIASRMNFDWVFPLDADEAIDCESRAALEKALQNVGQGCVGILPWRSYIPTAADDWAQTNPFRRIVNRKVRETPQVYKVAIPKSQLKLMPMVIASGNHTARRIGSFKQLSMTVLENVALAHFPVRSPDQLVSKVICGYLSMLAEGCGRPSRSFHWRDMYAQFMRNGAPTADGIERLARCYSGQTDDGNSKRSPLRMADQSPLRFRKNSDLPNFVAIARTAEWIIGQGHGLAEASSGVDMSRYRASWRNRDALFDGSRSDQDGAAEDYLNRRFNRNWQSVDNDGAPAQPIACCGSASPATNLVKAIVLAEHKKPSKRFRLKDWLENGWAVDRSATLALRLLATSARSRWYSVVLVPCEKAGAGQVSRDDSVPAPSASSRREDLSRMVLHCHFLAVKLYWLSRSAASKFSTSGISRLMKSFTRGVRRVPAERREA